MLFQQSEYKTLEETRNFPVCLRNVESNFGCS